MFLPVLVLIVAIAGVVLLILSVTNREKSNWIQFFARGKDAGFSFKEIEMLRKLAVKSNIEEPTALFFSLNQLDLCIRSYVKTLNLSGGINDPANQNFLSKLYDYRKKIEMDKPRIKNGISSSRQISDGQTLRVLVPGTGVFKSQTVKNTSSYLTITRPAANQIPGTFSWTGIKISVYFWRDEDAGYVFDTDVLDEVFSKGLASLKISHTDALFRTQKRKSIRLKMHKPAFLYLITNEEEVHTIEAKPGLKCYVEDLSDTGCAVTIGGEAHADLRVKIQFGLKNTTICLGGTVRSVDIKEETNTSLLHIEADPLPIEIRNIILGEVFGMLPEDEDDLPFRMLAEEAQSTGLEEEIRPPSDAESVEGEL